MITISHILSSRVILDIRGSLRVKGCRVMGKKIGLMDEVYLAKIRRYHPNWERREHGMNEDTIKKEESVHS